MEGDKTSFAKPSPDGGSLHGVILSSALLGNEKSVVILHEGQKYRLSITKLRKLILTK